MDGSLIRYAINCFIAARSVMRETFGVTAASEVVAQVLQRRAERNGRCRNGYEYIVHGVGYTVVFPSGAQVHIDSCGEGRDCFKVYDLQFFLNDAVEGEVSLQSITEACNAYARSGRIRKIDEVTFELP